jgi:hypothetical protein
MALVALLVRVDQARADGDVAAPTCVPTDLTLMEQLYDSAGNGYAFLGDSIGTFTVTCPVAVTNGSHALSLSYGNDTDGTSEDPSTSDDFYVKVEWKRRSKSTGAVSTLCADYSTPASAAKRPMCSGSSFAVDNASYFYWVYVRLHRSATQATSIRFNGISFAKQ